MLTVKQLSRAEIDEWPVAKSGLPVRVVNSTRAAGVRTVGQLRSWNDADLLKLRSLGRISLDHIHFFFRLCQQIEQGKQRFQSIQEVLDIFLDGSEQMVLGSRYGFALAEPKASRNCVTLQEIGNSQQRTRERVRQIEDVAKGRLKSRLAGVCLEPFYDYAVAFLAHHGGSASCAALAPLRREVPLAGHNPCGVLLLLSDLNAAPLTFHRGFFSTLPSSTIQAVETAVVSVLERETGATPLRRLVEGVRDAPAARGVGHLERLVAVLLDSSGQVTATVDNRYFLPKHGMEDFLVELLRPLHRPLHYRAVTNVFNEHVKPASRKGAGYILEVLSESPRCRRIDRGVYDLA